MIEEVGAWRVALLEKVRSTFKRANKFSGGILGIFRDAVKGFGDARGGEAAASMAYYALFSLFPLLLALVAAGSFFLDQQKAFQQVVDLVTTTFPISQNLIEENLRSVLQLRGAVGLIGLGVAFWSASGAFTVLTRNINRAWTKASSRNFIQNRLLALGIVGLLASPLVITLFLSTVLNLLSRFQIPLLDIQSLYRTPVWTSLSDVLPWFVTFALFVALYRWVPHTEVRWAAAFWAALVVALAWIIAADAFAWYVGSGLARYRLVYGSLGTVVALLFWIYLSSWIIIFGAHLSAAIARASTDDRVQPDS